MQLHSNGLPDIVQWGSIQGAYLDYYYVDTSGTSTAAVAAVANLHATHRLHMFFGPYSNLNAVSIQEWMTANMPDMVQCLACP